MSTIQKIWTGLWIVFVCYFVVFAIMAIGAMRTTVNGERCDVTVYWTLKVELEECKPWVKP